MPSWVGEDFGGLGQRLLARDDNEAADALGVDEEAFDRHGVEEVIGEAVARGKANAV